MVSPNTQIYLLQNVVIEEDQTNQMDFADVASQTNYFVSKMRYAYTAGDFTYQRADGTIRVPLEYDQVQDINYVMYQNTQYNTKWFYAFVTRKEYINANMTALHIKTDVFQTWFFEMRRDYSMIERQTTNSDNIGEYCQPEPIRAQAYPVDRVSLGKCSIGLATQNPILFFSEQPTALSGNPPTRVGFNSGSITMEYANSYDSIYDAQLEVDLGLLENAGQLDMISNFGVGFYGDLPVSQDSTTTKTFVNAPLTAVNNKTYNYCYGIVIGSSSYTLTVPHLKKHTFTYNADGWWGSSPFVVLNIHDVPNTTVDYRGIPIPSIVLDAYENAMNHRIAELTNTQMSAIKQSAITSALNGKGLVGTVTAGIKSYFQTNQEKLKLYEEKEANTEIEPSQVTGYASPSSNFAAGFGGIWLVRFAPTPEEFKRIDDFFSMFGYAINRLGFPNFNNRENWDYIKTIDINIHGEVPQEDMQELKNIFNNGITIWHRNSASTSNWCNYNQLNPIVQHNP